MGFSLIELMVAMLISLVLIFACTTLYSSLKTSIQIAQNLSKAQDSLRGSFYLLSRSLRQAEDYTFAGASSGANATELTVLYGETPIGDVIYSCLGNARVLGNTDIFSSDGTHLYCDDDGVGGDDPQLIALDVTGIEFVNISGNNDDGITVVIKIEGMPKAYEDNGFSFKLALRQKILLDLAE